MATTFGTNTFVIHLSALQWSFDTINYHIALLFPPKMEGSRRTRQQQFCTNWKGTELAGGSHSRLGSKTLWGASPSKGLEKLPFTREQALV